MCCVENRLEVSKKYKVVSNKITILDLIKEGKNKKDCKKSLKISKSIGKVSDSIELMPQEEVIARRVLNSLTNKGVIQKIGKTRGSYYVLKEGKDVQ